MRILLLGDSNSVHVRRWAAALAGRGYQTHLASFRASGVPGVVDHPLPARFGNRLDVPLAIPSVRAILRRVDPDVVHAHYATSYGLLGALSGARALVVTAWGSDVLVSVRDSRLLRAVVRFVIARAAAVTSDSAHMSARIEELGGAGKTHTIPFGVDASLLDPPGADEGADCDEREGAGAGGRDPWLVTSLRALESQYHIDVVIRAFGRLRERLPEARLVVGNDGPDAGKLRVLAAELGLDGQVTFAGLLPQADLAALLRRSSVFVSVPPSDATSVTLLEAMACGAFPVVSDLPANREWVEEGVGGRLVPPGSVEELAGAIEEALLAPEARARAAEHNRAIIRERARWEDQVTRVEALYRRLVGEVAG